MIKGRLGIFGLAFAQLQREGKATIEQGIPIYDFNDLLDRAITIRSKLDKISY